MNAIESTVFPASRPVPAARAAIFRRALPVLVASLLLSTVAQAANVVAVSTWTPIYQGIETATATLTSGATGLNSVVYASRIDLQADGISFTTTEKRGTLDSTVETTASFLTRKGVQLAINTGFFTPCCTTADVDIRGLAVSEGAFVSPATTSANDRSLGFVTVIGDDNVVKMGALTEIFGSTTVNTLTQLTAKNVDNAFSGSGIIVRNGVNTGAAHGTFGSPTVVNPRTVVGLSQDSRYLYLAAIDGRQAGYSEGVVMTEAADIMLNLGAWIALNVDGGGSTTMVRSDDNGGALVLNRPSNTNNTLRNVSNSLGVYALPLAPVPVPLPAAWLLFAPALLALKQRKRGALLH